MNFITGKVIEKCLKKLLVVTLVASLWKEQNLQSFKTYLLGYYVFWTSIVNSNFLKLLCRQLWIYIKFKFYN